MNNALKNYRTFASMICTFHREACAILERHESILRESGADYDAEAYAEARDEVIASHRTHTLENLQNCKNYLMRKYKDSSKYFHQAETELLRSPEEMLELNQAETERTT